MSRILLHGRLRSTLDTTSRVGNAEGDGSNLTWEKVGQLSLSPSRINGKLLFAGEETNSTVKPLAERKMTHIKQNVDVTLCTLLSRRTLHVKQFRGNFLLNTGHRYRSLKGTQENNTSQGVSLANYSGQHYETLNEAID